MVGVKKSDQCPEERKALADKLMKILEVDEHNSFYLYEMDHNEDKRNEILALIPEIKKYYSHSYIGGIKNQGKRKRPWLSIVRHILRDYYHFISSECYYPVDGKKLKTRRYYCNPLRE